MRPDHLGQIARIALVVPPSAYLTSLGAFVDAAASARQYVHRQYGAIDALPTADRFDVAEVSLLGLSPDRQISSGGVRMLLAGEAKGANRYDMVILVDHAVDEAPISAPDEFLQWLAEQRGGGAIIAASGAGVGLLAASGLLEGKVATGPWWMAEYLRERYPKVAFEFGVDTTEDDGIYCSSGSTADAAMAIRLLETVTSHNMAQWLERRLLGKGAAEAAGEAGPSPEDPLLQRAQHWLSEHFSRPVRIEELAEAMKVSRRTLVRHFTAGTGMSPIAYLQMLRVEAAKSMLERSPFGIDRIAGLVGYSDVSFFRRTFRRSTGRSPRMWRRERRIGSPT
jgi:transcriptional regulator GlxA family with amidase domain